MTKEKEYRYEHPRPALTVDVALFRRARSSWEILLVRRAKEPFKDHWALPGGFVDEMEALETAAARELEEECGVGGVDLWQLRAFGAPGRDPRGHTVSIAYLGILHGTTDAKAADDAAEVHWFPIEGLPPLAFDHQEIINTALERLHRIEEISPTGGGYLGR
ncbi:MAG: NUDIX domain-containing protein [Thermoanaerobaculia bacterium]